MKQEMTKAQFKEIFQALHGSEDDKRLAILALSIILPYPDQVVNVAGVALFVDSIEELDTLLHEYSDEELKKEVAPSKYEEILELMLTPPDNGVKEFLAYFKKYPITGGLLMKNYLEFLGKK